LQRYLLIRFEKQNVLNELRHLEYVLQQGSENLDSRESHIAKDESDLTRRKKDVDRIRSDLKKELDAVAEMKSDLSKKIKVDVI